MNKLVLFISLITNFFFSKCYNFNNTYINLKDERHVNSYVPRDLNIGLIGASLLEFMVENCNQTVIEIYYEDEKCQNAVNEMVTNRTKFNYILASSGRGINEVGLKYDCVTTGNEYILLQYNVIYNKTFVNKLSYDLNKFLKVYWFFTGICVPKPCKNFVEKFFNSTLNSKFMSHMNNKGIYHIEILTNGAKDKVSESYYPSRYAYIIIFLIVTSATTLFKIFFTIFGEWQLRNATKEEYKNLETKDESFSNNDDNSEFMEGNLSSIKISPENLIATNKKRIYTTLCKYFSFNNDFYNIFTKNNSIYNQKDILFISYLKVFTLAFLTINTVFRSLLKLPHRDQISEFFHGIVSFSLIKFTSYFDDVYVLLEGISMGFKLMNYINKVKEVTIKNLAIFFSYTFTRFVLFFIVFFTFYICIGELSIILDFISDNEFVTFFRKSNYDNKECFSYVYEFFIPFYLQYLNNNYVHVSNEGDITYSRNTYSNSNRNYSCFYVIHVYYNIFFSILFCLIITYLFFRFKSKIFEIFVFFLNIANIFTIYWMCTPLDTVKRKFDENINVTFLMGERISTIYPNILFGTFYLGFNIGICYFYFVDITKNPANYTHLNAVKLNTSKEEFNLTLKNSKEYSSNRAIISKNENEDNQEELERELINIKSSFIDSSKHSDTSDEIVREDLKMSNLEQISTKVNINSKESKIHTNFNFSIQQEEESDDLTFYYNFKLMVLCTYITKCSWILIRILCVLVILLLCFFYNFEVLFIRKQLSYPMSESYYVLYVYEKKIFLIFFIILTMSYIFKKTNFEYELNRNYSYVFERISFSYYLILESFIILIVSFVNDLRINIFNVVMVSIGGAFFTFTFSLYFSLLFEMPLRHFFKDKLRANKINVHQSILIEG